MDKKLQALNSSPLFQTFDENVLRQFAENCSITRFEAGDIIFVEMSEGDEIYLIADGEVSIRIALANADQEYEIIKEQRGDLLGEVRFIDSLPRSATAIAETDVELLVWSSNSWRKICMRYVTPADLKSKLQSLRLFHFVKLPFYNFEQGWWQCAFMMDVQELSLLTSVCFVSVDRS